jgi:hypothetical protein
MPSRVWILGAGFSRPLGAPLLNDLLSDNTRDEIRARFDRRAGLVEDSIATEVYRSVQMPLGHTNAEDLLEFLDAAASPNTPQARRLALVWSGVAGKGAELSRRARRIVAAECSAFLESNPVVVGSGPRTRVCERWLPYATWGANLNGDDVVISFNYDRVLENLKDGVQGANAGGADIDLVRTSIVHNQDALRKSNVAQVLKLHGSVDWLLDGKGSFQVRPGYPWLDNDSVDLAIGTPGPGKLSAATGPLSWLWRAACNAIRDAKEVFLVGYRFPETDGFARHTLLDALRDSNVERVQVVLGLNSPDAPRVRTLVRMAAPTKVVVRSVWSQDFLDQWRPT